MKKSESHLMDSQLLTDLFREISDLGRHIKGKHSHNYAFDPIPKKDNESYHRNMKLMSVIHDLLSESCVNIKSRGYTYIRDAICIITDHGTYDVCLSKDIYPHIARKHAVKGIEKIDHNIRNAINSAYHRYRKSGRKGASLMDRFDSRPTPKQFLLHLKAEVDRRMHSEAIYS